MGKLPNALEHRHADHPIDPLFLRRWSPRSMTGEPITQAELLTLFEAGRWAPSTYNEQEWRFLYARRDSPHWPAFFGLLMEANQVWCARASVLMVVLSHKVFTRDGRANPVHTFDAGAAFENGVPRPDSSHQCRFSTRKTKGSGGCAGALKEDGERLTRPFKRYRR